MTNLSGALRDELARAHDGALADLAERQRSEDGTVKYLFRLDDGATIESVYIPEDADGPFASRPRPAVRSGCVLPTGDSGIPAEPETWEILGQVAAVMADVSTAGASEEVVVMGMGEPLLSYDATVAACGRHGPRGLRGLPRRLTLSDGGHPARPSRSSSTSPASEPGDQPPRPERGPAPSG